MSHRLLTLALIAWCSIARSQETNAQLPPDRLTPYASPDAYIIGGHLLPEYEERALTNIVALGLAGDISHACRLITYIHRYRANARSHTGLGGSLRDEESFDAALLRRSQIWTSVLLSFPNQESDGCAYDDYKILHLERRRATKSLYQNLSALRYLQREVDLGFAKRQQQRAQLANGLWLQPLTKSDLNVSLLISEINKSLSNATRVVAPSVMEDVTRFHRIPLDQLIATLPERTAVIDIVRYNRLLPEPKKEKQDPYVEVPHYAAFILLPDKNAKPKIDPLSQIRRQNGYYANRENVARVELGSCDNIDALVQVWRRAIIQMKDELTASQRLSQLIWHPMKKHLDGVDTLYFVPDGAFDGLPWSALPIDSTNRILLERFRVAELPFCEYLLQAAEPGPIDRVASEHVPHPKINLIVGGVANDLKYGLQINEFFLANVPKETVKSLTGTDATIDNMMEHLSQAAIAHFDTHGGYSASALNRARRQQLFESLTPQHAMLFSAILLSNAPAGATYDTSILTAYMVSELDLSRLNLAVLAACETDVGEDAIGEGGFALTRAFHLAGCRDVVSTLWRVDDQATSIFMQRLYRELLNGAVPIDALRTTQLAAYHGNLELPNSSRPRFPLRPDATRDAGKLRDSSSANQVQGSVPPILWAGFQLSGPGNRALFHEARKEKSQSEK